MRASRIFRLLSVMILFAMFFGLAAGPAGAQPPIPPKERINLPQVSLENLEGYYGLLSQRQGSVKVVVELADAPAAQVYAAAGGGVNRNAISQSKVQINKIQLAQAAFMQSVAAAGVQAKEIYRTQRVLNGIALEIDSRDAKTIAALPGIKAIHPLISKTLDHTGSVPLVGALDAWSSLNPTAYQGEGVTVGIIDTGIDYTHKNFGGDGTRAAFLANDPSVIEPASFPTAKVVGGYDFAGDDYDADGELGSSIPAPDTDPLDCNGHGSHVGGTVAGLGILKTNGANPNPADYGTYAGLAEADYRAMFKIGPGMAPKAELYALKVFGCDGTTDVTDQAIEWAVDPNQDGDLSDHLDVINMSLGSSFGSEMDTSAIASNNAVAAGVIVVTSAGNSGDVYYINGSPGVAQLAISTAGSMDGSFVGDGFGVTQTPDGSLLPLGAYGSSNSVAYDWLAPNSDVTGEVKYLGAGNSSGCAAFPAGSFTGKIALLDWTHTASGGNECGSATRTRNAYNAGAIGVIMAYDLPALDITIAGYFTIPATITTLATGDMLKDALASPNNATTPLTVKLSTEFNGTEVAPYDPTIIDNVYTSSSRGPRRGDTGLKPDLTAPAVTIFSTAVGTGDQGVAFNGTSMASPHVAGAMALLRQAHSTWTVAELKALVMNSATHDVSSDSIKDIFQKEDRIGAGRLDVVNALNSDLIAYSTDNPGEVSVSFGFQEVVNTNPAPGAIDLTTDRQVTITNTSAVPVNANLTFTPVYDLNPGVTYSLVGVSNPVTIPANDSLTVTVRQAIDAAQLARQRDAAAGPTEFFGFPRDYLSQSGGYLVVTPTGVGEPALRVPVYAAHRQAATREAASDSFTVGAADVGTATIPMTGSTYIKADDTALVYVTELLHESPDDTWTTGINNNADLMAVGASSDFSLYATPTDLDDVAMYISIATQGKWTTPNEVEFDVFIDTDEDGAPDWVALNANTGFFHGVTSDTQLSVFCDYPVTACGAGYALNGVYPDTSFAGTKLNGQQFNSNILTLVLPAGAMGLTPDNTDFNFYVDTFNREMVGLVDTTPWMHYDLEKQAFDTLDMSLTGRPVWVDSGDLEVAYDKTDLFNQSGSMGLLLSHHHNAGNKAEVVRFDANVAALVWDKYGFINTIPGRQATIPVTIINETDTNCVFNLSANQAPTVWPVTLSTPQQYVPAHGSYVINAMVTVPSGAAQGSAKNIDITAVCQQDNAITAENTLVVHAANVIYMPLMAK